MKYIVLGSVLHLICMTSIHGEEGAVCPKCIEIREYNKTHHKDYEYFEDYLKDEEKMKGTTQRKDEG